MFPPCINFNNILLALQLVALPVAYGSISADVMMKKDQKNDKFPPCKTCKLYVESFIKGMEKTSKGNFAGGDTAWEEEKMKNYAKSEVRLIEIQEKLCSEVTGFQDQCHDFAAEIESEIEDWWFKVQHSGKPGSDLYTWLCIDTVKRCCPVDHYGPECKPCKGFPTPCFGNGKCKGNGTRKGNGDCVCSAGYKGEVCNECSSGYFESYNKGDTVLCSPCHKSCESDCSSPGPKGCSKCKAGWEMDKDMGCYDLNECVENTICPDNTFCVNTEGSYSCIKCDPACSGCHGDGPDMCEKCAEGYAMHDTICINKRKRQAHPNQSYFRYGVYLGLSIATFIIFQRNVLIASIIGVFVAIYVSCSEYILSGKSYEFDTATVLTQNLFRN